MTDARAPCRASDAVDVLVSGYASIDVAYRASAPPQAGATALLQGPVAPAWHCGGCGPGAAVALARAGCRVSLVTWLGDDREGRACVRAWTDAGVDRRGVVVASGQASPRSFLFYDPTGSATCYYHPSGSATLRLNEAGRELLADTRALAVTVGPAALTEELLAARRSDQRLVWNVKADGDAFPLAIRSRLIQEAAIICLNRDELPFVAAALPSSAPGDVDEPALIAAIVRCGGGLVVVTAGAAGCRVASPAGMVDVPANPVQVADPTGAGDAFFGAFVAAWLRGADAAGAAGAAARYVTEFLRERAAGETET
jgi:sugar/nucleoside kinase (ribokinase family)